MVEIQGGKFLVTGGASLIGSHLADALLAGGAAEVRLLDNLSLGAQESIGHLLQDSRVRVIRGDILRLNELVDAADGVDGIFALAGFLTLPLSQNAALGVEVNVRGMLHTLEGARIMRVPKVVFSSSLSVYGNTNAGRITEDMPYVPAGLTPASALYSTSKLVGEALGNFYASRSGPEFVTLRLSSVYGERQHARAVNAVFIATAYDSIVQGKAPRIYGDGSEVHDYIYVTDVAGACVAAMRNGRSCEVYNIGTGVDTSLTRIVELVSEACGRSGIAPDYQTDTRTVRSSVLDRIGFCNDKARAELGWDPQVPVAEGIRRYVSWRQAQALVA